MFRHYWTIIQRLITRQKGYFAISMAGLVLALAAVVLAFVYIQDETGYDRFHTGADRIFRVNKWVADNNGDRFKTAESAGLMGPALVADYPQVEAAARFMPWFEEVLLSYEENHATSSGLAFVDSSFFEVFDFEMVRGNATQATTGPGKIILTPALAKALFRDEDPVGKAVMGLGDQQYVVAGIVKEPPRNSHLQFDALVSWASTIPDEGALNYGFMNNWLGQTVYTYLLVNEPAAEGQLESAFPDFVAQYMPNRTEMYDFYLQPLPEIYLHSYDIRYLRGNKYGSAVFLKVFSIVSLLVLLIACFNYINISTARSLQRAKEVGIKKVLGAGRRQLLGQFLSETAFLVTLASIIALAVSYYLMPWFNEVFGRDTPVNLLSAAPTIAFLALVIVVTSIGAGFFPGWLLSGFGPVGVLRGKLSKGPGGETPRQILTTLQLMFSIALIAGTLVLNQQFRFMLNQDLGFDKGQVLVLNTPPGIEKNAAAFRNTLMGNPNIQSVSVCQAAIGSGTFGTTVFPEGSNGQEVSIQAFRVDTAFLKTYGMELSQGRFFSARFPADTSYGSVVINEELASLMDWKDPLTKKIHFGQDRPGVPVVGVVKDFHFNSFHEPIGPVVMWLDRRKSNISVRFDARNTGETLAFLENTWKDFESRYPFDYFFVDEFFAKNYGAEKQMLKTISLFSIIAIIIACLGLYGLTLFNVNRRTKEIGIRKVLGASVSSILLLLHRRLFYLTVLAFGLGVPLAYYFVRQWLDQYAYAIDIRAWVFLLAGLITLAIGSAAVFYHSWRAARSNPVKALRYE